MVDGENSNVLQEKHCRPAKAERHLSVNPMSRHGFNCSTDGSKKGIASVRRTNSKTFTRPLPSSTPWHGFPTVRAPSRPKRQFQLCRVSYTTHSIAGLSENDFICATKVDALIAG